MLARTGTRAGICEWVSRKNGTAITIASKLIGANHKAQSNSISFGDGGRYDRALLPPR